MDINVMVVRQALSAIGSEAAYGLRELGKLEAEGRGTEFLAETRAALEALGNTIRFDANNEYLTLLGKIGIGEVFDLDAKGPPSVNARFILKWVMEDLVKLNALIQKVRAACPAGGVTRVELDCSLLAMLLEAVATGMLGAFGTLRRELGKLLGEGVSPDGEGANHDRG